MVGASWVLASVFHPPLTGGMKATSSPSFNLTGSPLGTYSRFLASAVDFITSFAPGYFRITSSTTAPMSQSCGRSSSSTSVPAASRHDAKNRTQTFIVSNDRHARRSQFRMNVQGDQDPIVLGPQSTPIRWSPSTGSIGRNLPIEPTSIRVERVGRIGALSDSHGTNTWNQVVLDTHETHEAKRMKPKQRHMLVQNSEGNRARRVRLRATMGRPCVDVPVEKKTLMFEASPLMLAFPHHKKEYKVKTDVR